MTAQRYILASTALLGLAACEGGIPDFDLRDLGNAFDTSSAVENLPNRPAPDDRGVISYPNYQVVVAQQDDTIEAIAARLNLNADEVAAFNGIERDIKLRRDELIALPGRVSEPSPATGSATTGPITPLNIESIATTAIDRVEEEQPAPQPVPEVVQPSSDGVEPIRHKVAAGETVFQISRQYNVPVRNIAEWNGLGPDLLVRAGQFLLIPQTGAASSAPAAPAPAIVPPVVETPDAPTPEIEPAEEPPTANTAAAPFIYPVDGPILRGFGASGNEGIDISAPGGTNVRAANSGTVAAVTTDTSGIAIVVIRHEDGLLTVYTNLENLTVSKNDRVEKGDNIGKVRDADPGFMHFEVRRGLQALDPGDFLP